MARNDKGRAQDDKGRAQNDKRRAQDDRRRAQDDSEWLGMTGLAIFSHLQTVWTYPPPARDSSIIQLW